MDWNYPVKDFFKLNKEQQEDYILELAKHFYKRDVSTDSMEQFYETTNRVIHKFYLEEQQARKVEDFEKAEIFYQLHRMFIQLQDETEI